jgi:hypothetical protein
MQGPSVRYARLATAAGVVGSLLIFGMTGAAGQAPRTRTESLT